MSEKSDNKNTKKIEEFENNGMIAEQEAFERLYASYKEKKNHK